MEMIDTHAHLYLKQYNNDRAETVQKAIDAGVTKLLLPNIDSATINDMLQMGKNFPDHCFPMMGLHPTHVKENYMQELEIVETHLKGDSPFCAVGEIGLDYYWDKTFIEEQKGAFRKQIALAKEHNLPIVVHTRSSFEETIAIVEELHDDTLKGVFHCFGGSQKDADRITSLGFYLGIGGVVSFKNSGLAEVIKNIDLKHIVLETDAPFLAPDPFRGKRNESAYIVNIAEKIALLQNTTVENIANTTTQNALKVFCL